MVFFFNGVFLAGVFFAEVFLAVLAVAADTFGAGDFGTDAFVPPFGVAGAAFFAGVAGTTAFGAVAFTAGGFVVAFVGDSFTAVFAFGSGTGGVDGAAGLPLVAVTGDSGTAVGTTTGFLAPGLDDGSDGVAPDLAGLAFTAVLSTGGATVEAEDFASGLGVVVIFAPPFSPVTAIGVVVVGGFGAAEATAGFVTSGFAPPVLATGEGSVVGGGRDGDSDAFGCTVWVVGATGLVLGGVAFSPDAGAAGSCFTPATAPTDGSCFAPAGDGTVAGTG